MGYLCRSLVAQTVKRLHAIQNTWVPSLGQEDPLEEEMTTHSSILVWKVPWTEEPGRLQPTGLQRVRHSLATGHTHTHTHVTPHFCLSSCHHGH